MVNKSRILPHEIETVSKDNIHSIINADGRGLFRELTERDYGIDAMVEVFEEGFVTELRRTSKDLSKVLSQNITLDIYSKGFSDYTGDYTSEIPRVQLVTSIRFVVLFPLHSPF